MSYVLAVDQGTSSSRALVFDAAGAVVGTGQRGFDSSFPADGWVEQDPEVIWQTTLAAVRDALGTAGIEAGAVAAMGIANQRETTIVWDAETGRAVHPAIVWQDRRTAERCEAMVRDGVERGIREVTGLVVDPYFSSTKLAWLLEQDGIRRDARAGKLRFGTIDSFLIWRFTRGRRHCTDATNASRTQLYDIAHHAWSDTLLDYFDIPVALLPEVRDSVDDFGVCDAAHFGAPIPIRGVAGDQQAALVGQGCLRSGMTKSTYGTGCFVVTNTGGTRLESGARLLTTVGYRVAGETTFALEGSIFVAGVAVKWLRDRLGVIETAAETEAIARRIGGDTGGVHVVPAFTGLGAPHWRSDVRGAITGLTLDHGRDELVTATLKSVGFQTADLLQAIAADGVAVATLRVDGGMVANDWFCQFLADVVDVPVERTPLTESTALGAAALASVGAGLASDLSEMTDAASERRFESSVSDATRAAWLEGWRAAVQRLLAP